MTDEALSVNGAAKDTVRPSRIIQILAALTAAYLGVALYYAAISAFVADPAVAEGSRITSFVAAGAAVIFVALATQVRWRFGAALALSLSFIAQLAWAGWADPVPIDGDDTLVIQARTLTSHFLSTGEFAAEELYKSTSPTATLFYAVAIAVFGEDLTVLRMLTAALWTAQAWLVWRICEEVSELRSRGFAAALVFGLAPAIVVFGSVPSVEAVFGFFALLSVWLVLSHRRRGLALSAFLSGLLGAFAFLAHPSGVGYVAGLIAVLLVGLSWEKRWAGRWRMGMAVVACAVGFGLGVAPQAALNNSVEGGGFSIAPGPAIGLELAYGTNRAADGGHNAADVIDAQFDTARGPELRDADLAGRQLALDRISGDLQGHLTFAMTTKMAQIWGAPDDVLRSTTDRPGRDRGEFEATIVGAAAPDLIKGVFVGVLFLATLGALRLTLRSGGVRDPTRWVLVLVAVLCLAVAYSFLWARPRANLAFAPLLVLLAPIAFARLPRVMSARAEARSDAAAARAREEATERAFDLAEIHKPKPVDPAVANRSAEERLAMVLKGMSKPPRQDGEDEAPPSPAAAPVRPASPDGRAGGPAGPAQQAPQRPPRKKRDASA